MLWISAGLAEPFGCDGSGMNGKADLPWIGTSVPCDPVDVSLIWKGDVANFWTSRWLDGAAPSELAPSLFKICRLSFSGND